MKLNLIALLLLTCILTTKANSRRFQESGSTELTLNKGVKWKVDRVTATNVSALQYIARSTGRFGKPNLAAYLKKGRELQTGILKMIRECRMKGADHVALHHWLEPLVEKVAALNKAANAANADKALLAVRKQLNLFNSYFQIP